MTWQNDYSILSKKNAGYTKKADRMWFQDNIEKRVQKKYAKTSAVVISK